MNRISFVLVLAVIILATRSVGAEEWIITSGQSVGWIALGEKIENVEAFFGKTKDRMGGLYWYKERGLEFFAPEHQIERIIIVKPFFGNTSYITSSGIAVGSSCGDVMKVYGTTEKALFSRGVYVLNYFEQGITFFIKDEEVCKILLYRKLGGSECSAEK